jgi:hypothetical protein
MVETMLIFTFLNVNSIDIREGKGYLLELRLVKQAWVRRFSSWVPFPPPPLFIAQVQPAYAHALATHFSSGGIDLPNTSVTWPEYRDKQSDERRRLPVGRK